MMNEATLGADDSFLWQLRDVIDNHWTIMFSISAPESANELLMALPIIWKIDYEDGQNGPLPIWIFEELKRLYHTLKGEMSERGGWSALSGTTMTNLVLWIALWISRTSAELTMLAASIHLSRGPLYSVTVKRRYDWSRPWFDGRLWDVSSPWMLTRCFWIKVSLLSKL